MEQVCWTTWKDIGQVAEDPENTSCKAVKEIALDLAPATCTERGESKNLTFCRHERI